MTDRGGFRRGFSLIEVIIAMGIFAVSVPLLLGLLAVLQDKSTDAVERADATSSLETAISFLQPLGANEINAKAVTPGASSTENQRVYVARNLVTVGWGAAIPVSERRYAITIEHLPDIWAGGAALTSNLVAVTLRVEWPASALDGDASEAVSVLRSNHVFLP